MKIYKYYENVSEKIHIKGKEFQISLWKGSNSARSDALKEVRKAYDGFKKRFIYNIENGIESEYQYAERLIREEILEEFFYENERIGVISRNRYGALVLNSSHLMFIDIDLPIKKTSALNLLNLFSFFKKKDHVASVDPTQKKIDDFFNENPSYTGKLYRTFKGYRVVILNQSFDPKDELIQNMMDQIGADIAYKKLTQKQECFRARLTPKPWRVGLDRPSYGTFPYDDKGKLAHAKWLQSYESKIKDFSVCKLVKNYSSQNIKREFKKLMEVHDRFVLKDQLPLA